MPLAQHEQHSMSLECAGFARNFAMVEDQVQFLAGTLPLQTTQPASVTE